MADREDVKINILRATKLFLGSGDGGLGTLITSTPDELNNIPSAPSYDTTDEEIDLLHGVVGTSLLLNGLGGYKEYSASGALDPTILVHFLTYSWAMTLTCSQNAFFIVLESQGGATVTPSWPFPDGDTKVTLGSNGSGAILFTSATDSKTFLVAGNGATLS